MFGIDSFKRWSQKQRAENNSVVPGGDLGIVVLGYNRPKHLDAVLESLDRQRQIDRVHIWIDGTQGRSEFNDANRESVLVARRYQVRELHAISGHLGIEKMMLDALENMSARYDRLIIIEDDCFPLSGCIDAFEETLAEVADRPDVYSVYGCHFGTEPPDELDFTRFQGWGWAAHSAQIRKYLSELRDLFMMTEADYLRRIENDLTDDVRMRLDRTPGRDVLKVLQSFFSWDSATAFVTAKHKLFHRRTRKPVVANTGIVSGIGHFTKDSPQFRRAPFNMITLEEAWDHYDDKSSLGD